MTTGKQGLLLSIILGLFVTVTIGSKVLELSDRFMDVRKNGLWLVKFYAPWCGHCRKLEATWNLIAQDLHFSNVRVGRMDCTRFTNMASEFDIRGFPTILFFKGDKIFSYNGDRTRDDIVEFALRLEDLPIQQLNGVQELTSKREKNDIIFLFVSKLQNDGGHLSNAYNFVAELYQTSNYFYSLNLESITDQKSLEVFNKEFKSAPGIYVIKNSVVNQFESISEDQSTVNTSLIHWIQMERFPVFIKATQYSFSLMMKTKKLLVIAVMEENILEKLTPEMLEFLNIIKSIATKHLEEFKKDFLFGWAPQPNVINSLAMQQLEAPILIVVNGETYQYYQPDVQPSDTTEEIIVEFLRRIQRKEESARGGNGIFSRCYRVYFDISTTLVDMWVGNPVLTSVIFGLPLGFLSLICYSMCCSNILDADDNYDESDDTHEKQE